MTRKLSTALVVLISAMLLTACGSTKVYENSKTLVVRGTIYNVTDTKVFTSKTTAILADKSQMDVRDYERKEFEMLLEQNGGSVFVRQTIDMDDQEVVYRAKPIDSWSDFRRMKSKFEDATGDLQKFLAKPKETQLELD